MSLTNFRQPKSSLLSRYASITPEGEFKTVKNSTRLIYGGMLGLRIKIIFAGHYAIGKQATIAARYCSKRKQFDGEKKEKGSEVPVLQYQSVQSKLAPCISAAWMILLGSANLIQKYITYMELLQKSQGQDEGVFNKLAEIHGIASCLKPISTWYGEHFGELMKQACGGHGFLYMSGLTRLHYDFGVGYVTAEGDNTVLCQQTAMYLVNALMKGEIDADKFEHENAKSTEERLVLLLEIRYKQELKSISEKMARLSQTITDRQVIWNDHCQVDLVNLAQYFGVYFLVKSTFDFLQGKEIVRNKTNLIKRGDKIVSLVARMMRVYAIYNIQTKLESFYKNLDASRLDSLLISEYDNLMKIYREDIGVVGLNAVEITDGFDLEDGELASVLG